MQRIDAHQHFWNYDPVKDSWITEDMTVIRHDFSPPELETLLRENGFDGCVAVQADQSEKENDLLLGYAAEYDCIRGVVGWVDLCAPNIDERLEYYSEHKKMKGFRHILQGESKRDLMLTSEFKTGIRALSGYGFTYDILIYPDQLQFTSELVSAFPGQLFVVDHMAKPPIKTGVMSEWEKDIISLSRHENVYCKVSGFVTEADWSAWKKEQFYPYFDVITKAFGPDRLMFGSDWPVCLLAAQYTDVVNITKEYFASFSTNEQERLFGGNAVQFYNL